MIYYFDETGKVEEQDGVVMYNDETQEVSIWNYADKKFDVITIEENKAIKKLASMGFLMVEYIDRSLDMLYNTLNL